MNNEDAVYPRLAHRFVEMGLTPTPPVFPAGGVALLDLVPYWRLWPREPNKNTLVHPAACIFPVVAGGVAPLQAGGDSISMTGQSIFAGMLPLYETQNAVAQWVRFTIAASCARSFGGFSAPAAVLEALLVGRPEAERLAAWTQVVEAVLPVRGGSQRLDSQHLPALLECLGRSGLRGLAPLVCPVLQYDNREMVIAAVACLYRLGVPDTALTSDSLLSRFQPSTVDTGRTALAFVESGDLDRFERLLGTEGWLERVQALRLAEAVLGREEMVKELGGAWLQRLVDLLLVRLQMDNDADVFRCLGMTLGLAMRNCSELPLGRVAEAAGQCNDQQRFESLMNALLIAAVPTSRAGKSTDHETCQTVAAKVEGLRGKAMELGQDAVRALNRVLMALGEPCGSVWDWLTEEIVALRLAGILHVPEPVADWFDAPERCPEEQVVALLITPPDADLAGMFCAVYLRRQPQFIHVLENLWSEAISTNEPDALRIIGALLAGAPQDCAISPAELRCCLGSRVGGPLPETAENAGRLLGLAMTLKGEVRKSAEHLLLQMPRDYRVMAGNALRRLPRNRNPFYKKVGHPTRFGLAAVPLDHAGMFPLALQPFFSTGLTEGCPTKLLLDTLAFGGGRGAVWAGKCLDWTDPEVVRTAFDNVESASLSEIFLRVSSFPHPPARRLAVTLVAGVGLRVLQTAYRDRIMQRLVVLGQDGDAEVRAAVIRAAQNLGVTEQVPVAPIPMPKPGKAPKGAEDDGDFDPELEELLAQLGTP